MIPPHVAHVLTLATAMGTLAATPPRATGPDSLPVRIGVLMPSDDDPLTAIVRRAVRSHVNAVNRSGGVRGRRVEVVERSLAGSWGSGTAEIVRMVFDDDVLGVIGGYDGRSAHVIEQVVAKGQVVMISPWASDATLSASYVPWFFRMVPSDRQQAEALWSELLHRGTTTVAVLADTSYDGRAAADAFARVGTRLGGVPIRTNRDRDGGTITIPEHVDAVAVMGRDAAVATISSGLRAQGFGGLVVTGLRGLPCIVQPGMMSVGAGTDSGTDRDGPVAAYVRDAVSVLLHAFERTSGDRRSVRDAVARASLHGMTGDIRFDRNGDRAGPVTVLEPDADGGRAEGTGCQQTPSP